MSLAKYYENAGRLTEAIATYKDAFSFLDPGKADGETYGNIAIVYESLKNYDSALVYAVKAVNLGGDTYLQSFAPGLYARIPADARQGIEIDWELYEFKKNLHYLDQLIRDDESYIYQSNWLPDSLAKYKEPVTRALVNLVDSIDYLSTMKMFEKYSWPSYEKVGFAGAANFRAFMHIVRYPVMGKILLDKIKEFQAQGAPISKKHILFLEDNRLYHEDMQRDPYKKGKTWAGMCGVDRYNRMMDINKADSIRFAYNHVRLQEDVFKPDTLPAAYKPTPYPKNYFCLEKYATIK